jgi:PAS domain S-box-containing protein
MIASGSVQGTNDPFKRRRWLSLIAEPYALFPLFSLLLLAAIWATTFYLVKTERSRAMQHALSLASEMSDTYEAQVIRSLHEIDHDLKLVKYSLETGENAGVLRKLDERGLLLPELLFSTAIYDKTGHFVSGTGSTDEKNVADQAYFKKQVRRDRLWIGLPQKDGDEEALLHFSRRLNDRNGAFNGIVSVSVPFSYFVSGYEKSQLGKQGIIGLLGTDGIFRAKRIGKTISVGEKTTLPPLNDEHAASLLAWEGMLRFTSMRKLYGFPMISVVALSENEVLSGFNRNAHRYEWTAVIVSALLILFTAALMRISRQLDTVRKRAELNLRIAAAAFESQEAMMITDANTSILQVNSAFTASTGYESEEVIGKTPRILKSGYHDADFYRAMWEDIRAKGSWQGEIWDKRKDGTIFPKWTTISAVRDENGAVTHYVSSHYDITERKQSEQKIKYLAYFDQLTGLPNRTLLLDRLKEIMAEMQDGSYGALLFIDLDNFKTLNDTLGHHMGDLLLKQVAQRLAACVRAGDILARLESGPEVKPSRAGDMVARLGGDEFVLVLSGLSGDKIEAAEQADAVGKKILATLNKPYQLKDVEYHSTPSIGATLFLGQQSAIEDLMKQADLAMYRSKASGRNSICFFNPSMGSALIQRTTLEDDLRRAVEDRQLQLYYQAQITRDGHIIGAEALLRWQHPVRGLVMPAQFIPLAEESKLILSLGNWVLETACLQLAAWSKHSEMAQLSLSVNVSAQQFHQHDFVDQVKTVLEKTGADPHLLQLELTESLLLANVEGVIKKMTALKAIGIGFSLDDFGTGYSSLAYLKRLPLDHLKIDRSFVRDVLINPNDAAIANTIIALAKTLGLDVIAEGVESESQRIFLEQAGCSIYQGYFFCLPIPLEEFEAFAMKSFSDTRPVDLAERR